MALTPKAISQVLPELPEGRFWQVEPVSMIRTKYVYLALRKRTWYGSRALHRSMVDPDNLSDFRTTARDILRDVEAKNPDIFRKY